MTPPAGTPSAAPWFFWLSLLFILYTYAFYPLLVAWVARLRPRPVAREAGRRPAVTVILAARNEAGAVARRVENLLSQDYPAESLRVIVVSDGSTDGTDRILREMEKRAPRLRAIALAESRGKAAALNAAVAEAEGELLVFTDARQEFAPGAVARLAENFADPTVGSVSGELMLRADSGIAEQVGLYWRYEKWMRQSESAAGSMLGATGAIYAIRRELWSPLPDGTILDDFLVPMRIVAGLTPKNSLAPRPSPLAPRRAIFDGRAVAWDRAEGSAAREFRRKVRTLAGNFQAFALAPGLLAPWRNPSTWFQLWSHKVCRLFVPWALVLLFGASFLAPGGFYAFAALAQSIFYAGALAGLVAQRLGRPLRNKLLSLAATFTTLNAAAACALIFWFQGRPAGKLWRK